MKIGSVLFTLIASGVICLLLAGSSQATVPRAFVSINGSDANPCSAIQPCRSFNQALTVVEPGGEIVVQDSGGYSTGFTITKSVTIDAAGFNASVISTSSTDLCTINAGASDIVVLRGIGSHGANIGNNAIIATHVGSLLVEHCSISEFFSEGVWMPNGGNLFVTGTDVRSCGGDGVFLDVTGTIPAHLVAQDSRFTECFVGLGLNVEGTASASGLVTNCTAAYCFDGFSASNRRPGTNVDLTLTNCRAIGNNFGIIATALFQSATTIRIAGCVVVQNNTGIETVAGSVIGTSPGTNLIADNIRGTS
jgi:hypothetical protein